MASIKLRVDGRKQCKKNDGTYPIVMSVHHKSKTREIGLGHYCKKTQWDTKKCRLKSGEDYKQLNAKFKAYSDKANKYLDDNYFEIDSMNINQLRTIIEVEVFTKESEPTIKKEILIERSINGKSLTEFAHLKMARLRASKKNGYADNISDGLSRIHSFSGSENILFADISLTFLKNFEAYCYGRGNKPNTIGAYLRPIKALFGDAIDEGHISEKMNPFDKYTIPKSKTKSRALNRDDIQAIREIELKKGSALWKTQQYFLFMFNSRGMNFIDVVQLKRDQLFNLTFDNNGNLTGGHFRYLRTKLGKKKMLMVKLTNEAVTIVNYFLKQRPDSEFVFPVGFENSEAGHKRYKQHRKRFNKRLKEIAEDAGVEGIKVTSYYARHTWATLANQNNMPINMIQQGLGHADISTTQIYINSFSDQDLDDANDRIVA